ncbi:YafY family protein [Synechococcus sp. PCC 6312]|uniref:helix-turn-helix transcriptional regulator n=1 Tax=Synechococcus sp. (strain ATCC 27167 / PCC 6312) TaxID=195253 RepID=UPI00029F3FB0|nr:YafY family protein [Synechococcus sp. PCC 6312]AFY60901.1 putative transcriptional regulator [Synechococcus sp. PCC 6312]
MRKADRLFQVVNLVRSNQPITAESLAERIGVSVRTIYRYIDDLSISGIPIYGEPGVGYLMDENFELPPLTLNPNELDALILGVEMVSRATGSELTMAAKTLLSKIEAALPPRTVEANLTTVRALNNISNTQTLRHWDELYRAIQNQQAINIIYLNLSDQMSKRTVFPLGIFYWGEKWTVGAWCLLRSAYRDFRLDRIQHLDLAADAKPSEQEISLTAYMHAQAKSWKLKSSFSH